MISRFNRLISNVELHFVSLRACLSRRQFSRFLINDLPKKLRVEIGNVGKNIHGTSEIVYGIQPALAALIAKQRRVSCIFIRDDLHELSHDALFKKNPWLAAIVQLAPPDIQVKRVSRDFLTVLTNGRNNQGVAIECSPIPMPSVHGISAHSLLHFNHCMSSLPKPLACCNSSSIVLFLDRVQDVMNMGSILRSAVFFGVPCVLISAFFSATPTPLISKLSSGAMESLRFFRVTNPVATLKQLSEVGFIVVGTAGMQVGIEENFKYRPPSDLAFIKPEMVGATQKGSPKPLILVLGSEAYGLSDSVLSVCNLIVRIPGIVDHSFESPITTQLPTSLNIAAATAILLHQIRSLRS